MSSISTMVAAETEERTAKEIGAAYSDAGRIRFQEIYVQRIFDVSNAGICTITRRSGKAHGEVVWLAAAAWKLSQALRQRLPASLITSYVTAFGFPAADAVKWLRGAQAPTENARLRLCVTDDFGYQERRASAGPQVSQRGHAEYVGFTWYFIQAELTPIPQARLDVQDDEKNWDLDEGKRSVFLLAPRRLTHLQGLHHHVKKVLGPEYTKHFTDTPFARSGGVPGTTARLNTWLKKLGDVINSYATDDTVSPSLVFAVLVFLRGLEPGLSSVAPSVALRGFSFQQEKENQPEELATEEGLVAALKAEASVPEPDTASSPPQKPPAPTSLIKKLQGTWECLKDRRRMGVIRGREHIWDEPFVATLRSSPLFEVSANIIQIEIQGIIYNGRVTLGKTDLTIAWSDGDTWIKLREQGVEVQKRAEETKLEESQSQQHIKEEHKETTEEQRIAEEPQQTPEVMQDEDADDMVEWQEQPPENKEQKEDEDSDDVLENEYL